MSVQTIPVIDLADIQDGQMKEVDFAQGRILLSRIGDQVHATSAFCTHYGAPLAKGILTTDGRVVCPWHGACFNVGSGDIEDAPAPSPLHSFKTQIQDGKIYVIADPANTIKENKNRPSRLPNLGFETADKGVVIVGGGSGAFYAIESLREHQYRGPITVVSKEPHVPIDRTKLSKALITESSKIEWKSPADLKIKFGTTIRLGVDVTSIDLPKHQVVLEGGKDYLPYEYLILASGSVPRRLPIEGTNLSNVYTFRGVIDAARVDAAAQEGKRLVVIGSSFISMELVAALASRKLASIDVVGMEKYPFESVLGKEIGAALQKFHESQGVQFHMSSKVEKIIPKAENPDLAGGVIVNGNVLPADFVIMGVGVSPATGYLRESGIELQEDGGVKVNEFLQAYINGTVDPKVYAIGDISSYPLAVTGQHTRIEHWNVAGNHGRAAGRTIAGRPQPFVKIPIFWSAQGQQLRYCGLGHGYDDVIIKGDPTTMKFVAYYTKKENVVAVASMQSDPVVSKASELLRLGLMPTAEQIRNGKDILSIDISTINSLC